MFDIEYRDECSGNQANEQFVTLTCSQLKQLSESALVAAKSDNIKWIENEITKTSNEILQSSNTLLGRFLRKIRGLPVAISEDVATEIAKQKVSAYPYYGKNWMASDAEKFANKWLVATETLTTFSQFDLPRSEFDLLVSWASKK